MDTGLVAENISKSFGGVGVLDSISLNAVSGEVHSLIGPNGAGKSTLANIISGYVRQDGGGVSLNGNNLGHLKPAYRARLGLGRTFQNLELFDGLSVLQNVLMGYYMAGGRSLTAGVLRGRRVRTIESREKREGLAVLERVGLAHAANLPVTSLPYGEAKIVELARLIALGASAVVLDEPAAGLPLESAAAMEERIREMANDGVAVLLIEHNMSLVMSVSDKVTVLHHGECLASGTPSEVQANRLVIDAYLGGGAARREEEGECYPSRD